MRAVLTRQEGVHFEVRTDFGGRFDVDGAPAIGGKERGARPMETLLAALGACSSMDVVAILDKQRQVIGGMVVTVNGEREVDVVPSLFKTIHVDFAFTGELDAGKAARAVELSMGKYCSVTRIVEKTATVTHSCTVNGVEARAGEGAE